MAIVLEQPPSRKRNTVAEKGGKSEGKAEERRETSLRGLASTESVYIN